MEVFGNMSTSRVLEWLMVSGVGYGFFKLLFDFIRSRYVQNRVRVALKAESRSGVILDHLVNETSADYAQVVRIHNSGGDLDAAVPIFMTVIQEFKRPSCKELLSTMQGVGVDSGYQKLIGQLVGEKYTATKVGQVNNKMAAGIYDLMGAQHVVASLIRVTKKDVVFLRVTTGQDKFKPHEEFLINSATSKLKKAYR